MLNELHVCGMMVIVFVAKNAWKTCRFWFAYSTASIITFGQRALVQMA